MNNKLLITAIAFAVASSPAAAQTLTIGAGTDSAIPGNNDFGSVAGPNNDLGDLGLTILRIGASLTLSGPATITYEFLGTESGADDRFNSTASFTVFGDANNFPGGVFMFSESFGTALAAAGYAPFFNSSLSGFTTSHAPGTGEFGFFLPTGTGSGAFASNVVYFGYDNQITMTDDDNHDDFIVRATVTAVPEPATWAMMIGGFGLVGAAMRRRTTGRRQITA